MQAEVGKAWLGQDLDKVEEPSGDLPSWAGAQPGHGMDPAEDLGKKPKHGMSSEVAHEVGL
jgi:hypothetical protein